MIVRTRRPSSGTSRITDALRLMTICVLVVLTSGALPLASHWSDDIRGCGDLCARCDCKRRAAHATLRAPCPCCESHPSSPGQVTSIEPALLPASAQAPSGPGVCDRVLESAGVLPSFTPSVPHPPPRTVAFA